MASNTSEFCYPNFVHYYLTLYTGDYEMTGTYGEPLPSSPDGGDIYQTRPHDEYMPWLGIGTYLDRYWGEDQFSHGAGFDNLNHPYGSELVEGEEAYLGEEHHSCNNYSSDDDVEMQPGCDYISWSGDEYGREEDFHDYGNSDGVDTGYSYCWDERKLCESIFGYWPCLADQNQELHAKLAFD